MLGGSKPFNDPHLPVIISKTHSPSRRPRHGLHLWSVFSMIKSGITTEIGIGGFNIIRYGAGPNGPMRTLGQYMLGSGATFGYESTATMLYSFWRSELIQWQILHVHWKRN